jgi:DNA-binding NarL/FixJ family response regulator
MVNSTPASPNQPTTLPRVRVLVADDSVSWRQEFRAHLERLPGVQIIAEAEDCREAIALFFQHRPGLVLVSVGVPGQGGFEVLRSIRRSVPDCLVILMTRCPDAFVETTGRLLGATAVCSRTEGFDSVLGLIQRLVERQKLS